MAKSRTRLEFERAWKRFNGRIGKRGSLARMIAEGAYIGWKLAKGKPKRRGHAVGEQR